MTNIDLHEEKIDETVFNLLTVKSGVKHFKQILFVFKYNRNRTLLIDKMSNPLAGSRYVYVAPNGDSKLITFSHNRKNDEEKTYGEGWDNSYISKGFYEPVEKSQNAKAERTYSASLKATNTNEKDKQAGSCSPKTICLIIAALLLIAGIAALVFFLTSNKDPNLEAVSSPEDYSNGTITQENYVLIKDSDQDQEDGKQDNSQGQSFAILETKNEDDSTENGNERQGENQNRSTVQGQTEIFSSQNTNLQNNEKSIDENTQTNLRQEQNKVVEDQNEESEEIQRSPSAFVEENGNDQSENKEIDENSLPYNQNQGESSSGSYADVDKTNGNEGITSVSNQDDNTSFNKEEEQGKEQSSSTIEMNEENQNEREIKQSTTEIQREAEVQYPANSDDNTASTQPEIPIVYETEANEQQKQQNTQNNLSSSPSSSSDDEDSQPSTKPVTELIPDMVEIDPIVVKPIALSPSSSSSPSSIQQ